MLKKIKVSLICLSAAIAIISCTPEELTTKGISMDAINPEYAVPLVSSDLSLDNLIKNSNAYIKKYGDGSLSIVYRGQIFSATAAEAINIPDQNFKQTLALTTVQANALTSGNSQTISFQGIQSVSLGGREIDSIVLKAGSLVASINSEIRTSGNLKISFVDAKNLGTVLSIDVPFTYGGSIPVLASNNKLLSGYRWNMTNGGLGYNNVNIAFELTLNATTEPVSPGDKMTIDMGLTGLKFNRFYGYIGTVNLLNGGDTINLDVFDKASGGQFTLEDPKVKIICGNSFGVPVKAGFTKLAGLTNGVETPITPRPDPLPVPTPTMAQIGQMVYDSVTLEKSKGSNIATVISQKHKQVVFQTYIDLNPLGKQQRNFVTDYSQIKFTVDVELPLYGSARNFVFESEQPVDFKMPSQDVIEQILLRFAGTNGYPIDLMTQVYLMDSTGAVFDSIFTENAYKFIEAANVGTDGKVTSPTKKTTDIVFDLLRSKRLSRLKKVKFRAEIGTTSAGGTYPSVKLFTTYVLGVKIGIKAKLKLDSDLLDSLGK